MKNPFRKSPAWPFSHQFVNPNYRPGKGGLLWFIVGRPRPGRLHISPKNVSRWLPHNGLRECARRVRQAHA